MKQSNLMDQHMIQRSIIRISYEILEKNKGIEDIVLVGIKSRGVPLAHRISDRFFEMEGVRLPVGALDITYYRDDLSKKTADATYRDQWIPVDLKDKKVILVDDVIYTGRTVRAALDAILEHSRPALIQLAVLVDRGHRELPIRPDYVGKNVPTSKRENIKVYLLECDKEDAVRIYKQDEK